MKKNVKKLLVILGLLINLYAQDTLIFFQYNLLQYGASGNYTTKNNYLKIILGYVKPDLFGANEILNSPVYSENILQNVLEAIDGVGSWDKGVYTNFAQTDLTNMLFFKTKYFGLKSQKTVTGFVRDMNIYNMYYHKPGYDTIFFTVVVVHLRAATSGATERAQMAQALMDTLNKMNPKYLFLMGDLNLYTSNEQAFQTFTTYPNANIRLRDPVNRVGDWSKNPAFSDVHTQSTRLVSLGDGGSTSGLDDRFDFILCNSALFDQNNTMYIIPYTYKALAQDGNHFDKGLLDAPTITSVPSNVLNALYYNSDHLPIVLKVVFNPTPAANIVKLNSVNIKYNTLVENYLSIKSDRKINTKVIIYNILGEKVGNYEFNNFIDLRSLPMGMYLFQLEGYNQLYKFIKVK